MDTPAYISQLLSKHQLAPHPEGGYFRHTYTSSELMSDGRASMSSILFMLCDDNPTKFMHRNTRSDTIHMWHSGGSMRYWIVDPAGGAVKEVTLGPENPQVVVPSGHWKATEAIFGGADDPRFCLVSEVASPECKPESNEVADLQVLATVGSSTCSLATLQRKLSRFIRPANYGKLVEALYSNGMWYNALVTGVESTGELQVQFVDDGVDAVVSSEHVRQLGTYGGFTGFDAGATPEEMPPAVIQPESVIADEFVQLNSSAGGILIFLLDKLTCGLDILMTQLFGHGLARLALVSQTVRRLIPYAYRNKRWAARYHQQSVSAAASKSALFGDSLAPSEDLLNAMSDTDRARMLEVRRAMLESSRKAKEALPANTTLQESNSGGVGFFA